MLKRFTMCYGQRGSSPQCTSSKLQQECPTELRIFQRQVKKQYVIVNRTPPGCVGGQTLFSIQINICIWKHPDHCLQGPLCKRSKKQDASDFERVSGFSRPGSLHWWWQHGDNIFVSWCCFSEIFCCIIEVKCRLLWYSIYSRSTINPVDGCGAGSHSHVRTSVFCALQV